MKNIIQLVSALVVCVVGSGCASLTLLNKTAPVTEHASDIKSVSRYGDSVVVAYRGELITTYDSEVTFVDRLASFDLPHTSGTNTVVGHRITSATLTGFGVPVIMASGTNVPKAILDQNGFVVVGSYLNQSAILERSGDFVIRNYFRIEDEIEKPGWWAMPTRIIFFPVAVALDIATIPIMIVYSPIALWQMSGGH